MKIQHQFTVDRPIETVWDFFQEIPAVADCLPGAELLESREDGVHLGKVSVKLGPMTATFEGEATITPDVGAKSANISGKGVDKRGGSRGQVNVDYVLVGAPEGGTQVDIDADVVLSGPAAQFGRTGLVNEISKRLIADFVACLEGKLAATSVEEAAAVKTDSDVNGLALFFAGLWAWLKRLFGRTA